jgi:A nuclease of the HNH/ENDO VII superfamily with conserved LHH
MLTAARWLDTQLRRQGFLVQPGFAERLLDHVDRKDVQLDIGGFRQRFLRARHHRLGSAPGQPHVALVQAFPIVYRRRRGRVELLGVLTATRASVLPEREQLLAPWWRMVATALAPSQLPAGRTVAGTASSGSSPCGRYPPQCPQPPVVRPVRQITMPSGTTILDPGFEGRRPPPYDPWPGHRLAQFQWSDRNLQRALCGLAPWGSDGRRVELHHRAQQPNGPLDEYNYTRHKQIHSPYPYEPSQIDPTLRCGQRQRWWVQRALDHLQQRGIR